MDRCKNGCKYFNIRWDKEYCDKKQEFIKNKGRFCNKFIPDTFWSKFLKKIGF